jgi:hypothetical protein
MLSVWSKGWALCHEDREQRPRLQLRGRQHRSVDAPRRVHDGARGGGLNRCDVGRRR